MRKRNWRQYNKALVQRGSLSFLIDPKCLKQMKPKKRKGGWSSAGVFRPTHFDATHDQDTL